MQYSFNDKNKAGISFNRRIVRIGFGDLNPIGRYQSPFIISVGNPSLESQFVNYLELNYQFKQLLTSFSYSHQSNSRLDIPQLTQSATSQTNLYTNIKSVNTYQVNISYPVTIASWWRTYNNGSFANNISSMPNSDRLSYASFRLNTSQSFRLGSSSNLELSGRFNSKYQNYYTVYKAIFALNIGYKQSLLGKKMDVVLSVSDVFGTNKFHLLTEYPNQQSSMISQLNSRTTNISLKYNFNSGNSFRRSNSSSKGDFGEKRF